MGGNSVQAVSNPYYSPIFATYGAGGFEVVDDLLLEKLAMCESSLNPQAVGDKGTSFGLFQYKRETWDTFCKGDIWSADDQIACASKMINDGLWYHWKNCWNKIKN